jgi:hypothetical protein
MLLCLISGDGTALLPSRRCSNGVGISTRAAWNYIHCNILDLNASLGVSYHQHQPSVRRLLDKSSYPGHSSWNNNMGCAAKFKQVLSSNIQKTDHLHTEGRQLLALIA